MNIKNNEINLYKRIWKHLQRRRKFQFVCILFFMVFSSVSELISLGSVIPFLTVLINPDVFFNNSYAQIIINIFGVNNANELTLLLSVFFISIVVLNTLFRLALLWMNTKFSFAIGADFGVNIYKKTLHQPFKNHLETNTAGLVNGIINKANAVVYNTVSPILNILSTTFIFVLFVSSLIFLNSKIALFLIAGFAIFYLLIIFFTKKVLLLDSERIATESTSLIKIINEGFGGIRDIIIDRSQNIFINLFRTSDITLKKAQARNAFINSSPRYIVEAVGIIIIVIIAINLSKNENGILNAIPFLGAIIMGAQRILPLIQQAFSSWALLQGGKYTLIDVLDLLDKPEPKSLSFNKNLLFTKHIQFNNIYFSYSKDLNPVLSGFNLEIKKGSRVGLIGKTGSGKSTFIDVLMGLLAPTKGGIIIDSTKITNKNLHLWQEMIAHVPQDIYLSDKTIVENVAFGVSPNKINLSKVKDALTKAELIESINKMPNKLDTIVGERGVRLSGGQKQRIGIARALYKDASLIIFDEATSSLDSVTEKDIMRTIASLSKDITLIIIAHRFSTLKSCSHIYKLDHGNILGPIKYGTINKF